MHRNLSIQAQNRQNELFVGNLSYFCTEADLFNLFSNFGVVQTLRIKHNDKGTRSLQFGFVCLNNLSEAEEARRVLNGAMVMGRNIKVEFSQVQKARNPGSDRVGVQLHIQFYAEFPPHAIVKPTEEFLRRVYERFGPIIDVSVKEYHEKPYKQDGYGFISFATEEGAINAASNVSVVVVGGVKLTSSLSRSFNHYERPPTNSPFQSQSLFPPKDVPLFNNSVVPSANHVPQQALPAPTSRYEPQSSFSGLFSTRHASKIVGADPFNATSFLDGHNNDIWGSSSSMHSSGSPLPLDDFNVFSSAVAAADSFRGITLSDTLSFDTFSAVSK